ncbi:MAG: hypothetical protein ACQEXQ_30030 [Bacillota bacterium]
MGWLKRGRTFYYKLGAVCCLILLVWYLIISFYSPHLTVLAKIVIDPKVNEEQMITYAIETIYKNKPIFQEYDLLNKNNIKDIDIRYFNVSNRTGSGNNTKHDELNLIIIFNLDKYLIEVQEPRIEAEILLWQGNFVSFSYPSFPNESIRGITIK